MTCVEMALWNLSEHILAHVLTVHSPHSHPAEGYQLEAKSERVNQLE